MACVLFNRNIFFDAIDFYSVVLLFVIEKYTTFVARNVLFADDRINAASFE